MTITVSRDFGAESFRQILSIVHRYFDGLYWGDREKLREIFHPDAFLKAPESRRDLNQWLDDVANRPVPAKENHAYNFQLLSIELAGDQAMVKLSCPLFEFEYIDFLGLLKENGHWLVVNKMYADMSNHRT